MLEHQQSTCWTMIEEAAAGHQERRDEFARRYAPVATAYLCARWRSTPLMNDVDDVVQEVLMEFLKESGPLQRADRTTGYSFRGFLYGVTRNVALRAEKRRHSDKNKPGPEIDWDCLGGEECVEREFNRAWALSILREATEHQAQVAPDEAARRRHRLLELRFHEQKPIREIATLWNEDATHVHREYSKARDEFKRSLLAVLTSIHPEATAAELDESCRELLTSL